MPWLDFEELFLFLSNHDSRLSIVFIELIAKLVERFVYESIIAITSGFSKGFVSVTEDDEVVENFEIIPAAALLSKSSKVAPSAA